MKKIKSEELLAKFQARPLNDEELERVTGGATAENLACINNCYQKARQDNDGEALQQCLNNCVQ